MQSTRFIHAVFIVPPKVHLLDITGPAHIFYEAEAYGAKIQSTFSSIFTGEQTADSSSTLSFHRLTPYDTLSLQEGDLVFVPGLDAGLLFDENFLQSSRPFQLWLLEQHTKGVMICSVCTGAFLLAAAGILNGRSCTTHWKYAARFRERYPLVTLEESRLFVQDENIFSSAGVSSGIDLALFITEQLWGAHFAAQIAKEVVIYFRRTINDPQLSVFTQYRNHLENRIHEVQDLLSQSLQHHFVIGELAEKVNMSPRNLTRLFKSATGITIGEYTDRLRAEHARKLIEEGHTLQAAALHCGLKSTNQLRNLLAQ